MWADVRETQFLHAARRPLTISSVAIIASGPELEPFHGHRHSYADV